MYSVRSVPWLREGGLLAVVFVHFRSPWYLCYAQKWLLPELRCFILYLCWEAFARRLKEPCTHIPASLLCFLLSGSNSPILCSAQDCWPQLITAPALKFLCIRRFISLNLFFLLVLSLRIAQYLKNTKWWGMNTIKIHGIKFPKKR